MIDDNESTLTVKTKIVKPLKGGFLYRWLSLLLSYILKKIFKIHF